MDIDLCKHRDYIQIIKKSELNLYLIQFTFSNLKYMFHIFTGGRTWKNYILS